MPPGSERHLSIDRMQKYSPSGEGLRERFSPVSSSSVNQGIASPQLEETGPTHPREDRRKVSHRMSITRVLLIFLGTTVIVVFRVRCFFHLDELPSSDVTSSLRLTGQKASSVIMEREEKKPDNIIHVVNTK